MIDFDQDDIDGALFRFWIRAASYPGGWPFELAEMIGPCTTLAEYRKALFEIARRKGVNLASPEVDKRLVATFALVGPKPPWGFDLADAVKVRSYEALREILYGKGGDPLPASGEAAQAMAAKLSMLHDALAEVLDGIPAHEFPEKFGISAARGAELRKLAGLDQ